MSVAERCAAGEELFDFCLWPYVPPAPVAGKLRPVNILRNAFAIAGLEQQGDALIGRLRGAFGDSRTVWGIKLEQGRVSWELYFYDYARLQRTRSVPGFLAAVGADIPGALPPLEDVPYFMFSVDVDGDLLQGRRTLAELQIYIGNIGSNVSSGICYQVTGAATTLRNFYFFFDRAREMEDIVGKMSSSMFLQQSAFRPELLLWPELVDCQTIVVANKVNRDGLYFSRIKVDQLLYFLRRLDYPAEHVKFIERNRGQLDHILYDVGFDYRMRGGRIEILKSAYYAIF